MLKLYHTLIIKRIEKNKKNEVFKNAIIFCRIKKNIINLKKYFFNEKSIYEDKHLKIFKKDLHLLINNDKILTL